MWYFHTEGNHWKRVTIAPDFHAGFARIAKKTQFVILLLRNEHFTWFKPPVGLDVKTVKRSWVRESAIPDRKVLQGAAPKSSGAPSPHSLQSELCSPAKKSVAKPLAAVLPLLTLSPVLGLLPVLGGERLPLCTLCRTVLVFLLVSTLRPLAADKKLVGEATGSSHVCGPKKGHVRQSAEESPQARGAVKGTEVYSGTPSLHDLD